MSRPSRGHCLDAMQWLKTRGWNLAGLTGQDRPALEAVAHGWRLWGSSDTEGRAAAIAAIGSLVLAMQEQCWPMARELAAQALDWNHRAELWPEVVRAVTRSHVGFDALAGRLAGCHVGCDKVRQPDGRAR
jgi:hypothetical protein